MRVVGSLLLIVVLAIWPQSAWTLANPASAFCVKSGGKSEIRRGANGEYGVCRLPDGRVVEEWTYYREMKRKGKADQDQ
jgi:putative hemolysin